MVGQATFLTIPAGDWLQAIANVIGVALTIVATLWLERKMRQRRDRRRLRDIVRRLEALEAEMREHIPPELTEGARNMSALTQTTILRTIQQFRFVRERAVIDDPDEWLGVEELALVIDEVEPTLRNEQSLLDEPNVSAAVYAINHSKVSERMARVANKATNALAMLK